jgi:FkbM family methyltransferase
MTAALKISGRLKAGSCWDFGAHFGIYTVALAMEVGESGQVAAFEPDPISFRRLERHVRMNHFTNVKLFNLGVSDRSSQADLIVSNGKGSVFSHFRNEDEKVDSNTSRVKAHTIAPDLLVEKGELKPPDFIKVDVQGHGKRALKGSILSIGKKLPIILFSCHSKLESEGIKELLTPLGYEVFDTQGSRLGWDFFESPWNQTAILKTNGR